MKYALRSFLSVLLALMLAALPLTALATGANYTQQYELALGLLSDLLNTNNLREAARLFRELGSHSLSMYYAYYTDVVLRLQEDDAAAVGEGLDTLGLLEMNEMFTANLAERGLPGCTDLRQYGEARQLELAQRYTEAQAMFASLSILDAIGRAVRLSPLAREEQRQAAEEAARQEAERKAAEEAARQEAERKAAEEAARLETERKATEEAAKAEAERKAVEEAARQEAERKAAEEAAQAEAERKAAEEATRQEAMRQIAVGSIITFGHYEQDNDLSNGPEPIEWLVLDVKDGRALLLSKYGLDLQPYHNELIDVTWEKCYLRSWLNKDFIIIAFTAQQKTIIHTTTVDNSKSQGSNRWNTNGGNNTEDKIFLLSCSEANKYFRVTYVNQKNVNARMSPTMYAINKGSFTLNEYQTSDGSSAGSWYLRSPGDRQKRAAGVSQRGSLISEDVSSPYCVRPAMWINLESGIF